MRGIAAARRYPVELSVELLPGTERRIRIEQPGPFVLRSRVPVARLPKSDGYLALRFSSDAPGGDASTGVIVREVGWAARAATDASDRAPIQRASTYARSRR